VEAGGSVDSREEVEQESEARSRRRAAGSAVRKSPRLIGSS
jgi:hypothetical protein